MKKLSLITGMPIDVDIKSANGKLLLASNTILKEEQINKLNNFQLDLIDETKQPNTKTSSNKTVTLALKHFIKDTSKEVETIFNATRYSNNIPIMNIKEKILPTIKEMAENHNLFLLLGNLEQNDNYTYRHSIGVAVLATLIGKWLNLNSIDLRLLGTAAILHDIGKMKIPEEILNKPGKLTEEEFQIMKKHTIYGYDLIKNTVGASHKIALVALQHHEREDGSGYPFGLKSQKIHKLSKIVAVADVFHAMTSNRIYQQGKPIYQVINSIKDELQGKLAPDIFIVFLEKIMQSLVGSEVLIDNGKKAKIIMINPSEPLRPLIKVEDIYIDLSKNRSINIEG